jgi:hypothetical protein
MSSSSVFCSRLAYGATIGTAIGGEAASWLFRSRRQALTLLEHCTVVVSAA